MRAFVMRGFVSRKRVKPASFAAPAAAAIALGVSLSFSTAALAESCRNVSGNVSPLTPVACSGYIGCFQGTIDGDLRGSFTSGLTDLKLESGVMTFQAQSTVEIQAPNGTFRTVDLGVAECIAEGICPSATETLIIVPGSGDGAYKHASGSVTLSGPYIVGQPGTYSGRICIGKAGSK